MDMAYLRIKCYKAKDNINNKGAEPDKDKVFAGSAPDFFACFYALGLLSLSFFSSSSILLFNLETLD